MLQSWLRLLSLALLTIALTVPLASTAQAKPYPDQIDLPNGGRTLSVVQNQDNQVAVIKLNAAGTSGTLAATLTSADFDVPTTVAALGNSLYLPNARFTTPPTPTTQYSITRIDR